MRLRSPFATRVTACGLPVLLLAIMVALWYCLVTTGKVQEYVLPSPVDVGAAVASNFRPLLEDLYLTMLEALLGFLGANVLGIVFAVLMATFSRLERAVMPWLVGLKAVPLVALSPLLLLWFGPGLLGKAVMAGVVAFFPVTVNALAGFKDADESLKEYLDSLNASLAARLRFLYIPSALPAIFAGLKVSCTLATLGAVVAELAGAKDGIGARILIASYQVDTEMMFAGLVMIAAGSNAFYGVVAGLERLLVRWRA